MCPQVLENPHSDADLNRKAKLLKGKALFYRYQKKVLHLISKQQSLPRMERKLLEEECFLDIKETIALLGNSLDIFYIDEEGSKLLDWAMMDCIQTSNQLNLCKRCLMCRQKTSELRRSHLWPESLFRNYVNSHVPDSQKSKSKVIIFGMDKYQLKSSGECWYWLLCKKCEELISQNAENEFSKAFVQQAEVAYSSWFYNFCCAVILRTIVNAKFPMRFNDDEVYSVFLACRVHLLKLPVRIDKQLVTLSQLESFQIDKLFAHKACHDLKPFFLVTPTNLLLDIGSGSGEYVDPSGLLSVSCLSTSRLVDGTKDLAGLAHFFTTSFRNYHIIICFSPSSNHAPDFKFQITDSCGVYKLSDDSEKFRSISKGHQMIFHRALCHVLDVSSYIAKSVSRKGAKHFNKKSASAVEKALSNRSGEHDDNAKKEAFSFSFGPVFNQLANKPCLNFLPHQFILPDSYDAAHHFIQFPAGHKTVLHGITDYDDYKFCVLLNVSAADKSSMAKLYVIYALFRPQGIYWDGAYIESKQGKLHFLQYLLENDYCSEQRATVEESLQISMRALELLQISLIGKGIFSIDILYKYLKIQNFVKWSSTLNSKCFDNNCWYCKNRCHYCLQEARSWSKVDSPFTDVPFKFCSKECLGMFCLSPTLLKKSIFVNDHVDDANWESEVILDIFRISRMDGDSYNTVDVLHVCLADGKQNLARNQPYVLWVTHKVDPNGSKMQNLLITEEGEILEVLSTEILDCLSSDMLAMKTLVLENLMCNCQAVLQSILNLVMLALGYESFQAYISQMQARRIIP